MRRYRVVVVQLGLLLFALSANAAVRNSTIRITILDSETHSVTLDNSGVPKNCDGVNYDAYCLNSKTSQVTNTLLVQEGDRPPYRVTCTVETKWSRCAPLPRGSGYDAKREKRGLVVYFVDDNGKLRKQLYTLVAQEQASAEQTASPAVPVPLAPSPVPAESTTQAPVIVAREAGESVKCSFTSTPTGAEVTVDGRYVGSTPSVLSLSIGTHAVVVSAAGFAQWKRELTVSPGSELTVNAILVKGQ